MWELQPVFRVQGFQFIYTLEEAWQFKNTKRAKPDTLFMGNLRASSIDSILNITTEIKGDSVYKLNAGIMSGEIIYLDIASNQRKLNFRLDNSYDSTAKKIVEILERNSLSVLRLSPSIRRILTRAFSTEMSVNSTFPFRKVKKLDRVPALTLPIKKRVSPLASSTYKSSSTRLSKNSMSTRLSETLVSHSVVR